MIGQNSLGREKRQGVHLKNTMDSKRVEVAKVLMLARLKMVFIVLLALCAPVVTLKAQAPIEPGGSQGKSQFNEPSSEPEPTEPCSKKDCDECRDADCCSYNDCYLCTFAQGHVCFVPCQTCSGSSVPPTPTPNPGAFRLIGKNLGSNPQEYADPVMPPCLQPPTATPRPGDTPKPTASPFPTVEPTATGTPDPTGPPFAGELENGCRYYGPYFVGGTQSSGSMMCSCEWCLTSGKPTQLEMEHIYWTTEGKDKNGVPCMPATTFRLVNSFKCCAEIPLAGCKPPT